ncbi:MAG: ParA family protein [Lachnospiraceae bacterium]|nr:ParA family protein [Lachnospiraceae bacterium]
MLHRDDSGGSGTMTIAFANNKGGSGKTTTCANLGYSLSLLGKRVLLVDGDMQLNLSLSFFPEDKVLEYACGEKNLYTAMKKEEDLWDYVIHTPYDNLDLIPSSTLMSGIEYELFTKWQRELILSRSLKRLKEEGGYDYILIDAPPTLGGWVMNILCASDGVILPVEASPWGLFGVANMFEFLENVKKLAPELSLLGVVITKMDARKNYGRQTLEALQEFREVNLFRTIIRVDSEIEWAQDNSRPVMVHKKSARSAGEYLELAKEVDKICQ